MTRFSSLLEPQSEFSVGQQQKAAIEQLAMMIRGSRLHSWKPGDPMTNHGRRILLGVASYSLRDLKLLDTLNEGLDNESAWPRLDIFNCLECRSVQDFEHYVPGIGKVLQTPVVGYWEDGILKERAWGKAGRDLLTRILGVSF